MWAVAIYYIYGIAHLDYVAFKNVSQFSEPSFGGQALVQYNQYFIVGMGDMIPQLSIPPIPILPHASIDTWFLAILIRYLAHMM